MMKVSGYGTGKSKEAVAFRKARRKAKDLLNAIVTPLHEEAEEIFKNLEVKAQSLGCRTHELCRQDSRHCEICDLTRVAYESYDRTIAPYRAALAPLRKREKFEKWFDAVLDFEYGPSSQRINYAPKVSSISWAVSEEIPMPNLQQFQASNSISPYAETCGTSTIEKQPKLG